MSIRISSDPADQQLTVIHGWLTRAYWSIGIPQTTVARALANSICIGAFAEDGRQCGFARVVTDRATFAYLCDVFVDESARGQGVASLMLNGLDALTDLQGLRRWMLVTHDAHALYRRHGWVPATAPEWVMERVLANPYGKPAE